ncbi:MAG: hypothetical protein KIT36_22905 [Alphaproteobacteria bacterium]|nr:hypothetical protein [Alphaproteobacteria bacterium]
MTGSRFRLADAMRVAGFVATLWLTVTATAQTAFPPTQDGARALLAQFLPGSTADKSAAMKRLQPTTADYRAVYKEPLAGKLEEANRRHWQSGAKLGGRPDQTELLVVFTTTDDLINGKPVLGEFPGGYRRVTDHMNRGLPIVRFKYVKPGSASGMAFDGLVHVNGRWVFMPKPWSVVEP